MALSGRFVIICKERQLKEGRNSTDISAQEASSCQQEKRSRFRKQGTEKQMRKLDECTCIFFHFLTAVLRNCNTACQWDAFQNSALRRWCRSKHKIACAVSAELHRGIRTRYTDNQSGISSSDNSSAWDAQFVSGDGTQATVLTFNPWSSALPVHRLPGS